MIVPDCPVIVLAFLRVSIASKLVAALLPLAFWQQALNSTLRSKSDDAELRECRDPWHPDAS